MSGKRDRPADFEIDQKTLQYKEKDSSKKGETTDPPQKIKERKIYKIKGLGDNQQSGKFTFSKPNFTLFDNSSWQISTSKDDNKEKEEGLQNSQKGHSTTNAQSSKNQTQKKPDQKPEAKQKPSLFNFSLTPSIFSSNKPSMFSNNTEGIFGKTNNSNSIFGPSEKKTEPKPSVPLFGTTQSIFNFGSGVPPIKKDGPSTIFNEKNQDGSEGDSAELQADQKQAVDPSKSTGNYEYQSNCENVLIKKLLKVKKANGQIVQNCQVVIQKDESKQWVVVRLIATKNQIITGFLIKDKSEVKKLGNKEENIAVSIMSIKQKKPQIQVLKLQFPKGQDGNQFRQAVEKYIK